MMLAAPPPVAPLFITPFKANSYNPHQDHNFIDQQNSCTDEHSLACHFCSLFWLEFWFDTVFSLPDEQTKTQLS